jgi:hypothetical protein
MVHLRGTDTIIKNSVFLSSFFSIEKISKVIRPEYEIREMIADHQTDIDSSEDESHNNSDDEVIKEEIRKKTEHNKYFDETEIDNLIPPKKTKSKISWEKRAAELDAKRELNNQYMAKIREELEQSTGTDKIL